ncbi:MAG: hypothetical protein RBS48_07475 [Ignavibacteriaceae bacterium]|jgi:hypothetical protein|nr:hypothetical protein [Ignavibacteriaceae bacterium]
MGGKAALLLVLGFSLIFLVVGHNFNRLTIRGMDNYSRYYIETIAYNIAVSGANLAANSIFMDKTWEAGFSNLSYQGGTLNVYVSNNAAGNPNGKVTICHIPPGNSSARHTMSIPAGAVAAHLAHGDFLGTCDANTNYQQLATIVSEGTFEGVTKTIIVELRPSNFAKFGNYYASISSAYPATGDTFDGPFHTNGKLTTMGSPVFLGKVSTRTGLTKSGTPKDPKFYGGYETGLDLPLVFDTTGMRSKASKIFRDTTNSNKKVDVKLYFNSNSTVTFQQRVGTGAWSASKTQNLSTFAPNGIIYVERGNVYTKGVVNGNITIAATKKGTSGAGGVYFEDDFTYASDPRTNPNSDDLAGIIAEETIRIQSNSNTLGKSITTMASMYCMNGTIGPEDGLVNQNFLGNWNIFGGLIADDLRVTANYNNAGNPYKGLRFVHKYDERLLLKVPPYFPHTNNYEVVSWFE